MDESARRGGQGGWSPPSYQVDANGKVVGAVNDHVPNNWGRWGELDQLGTVNFITPELVAAAARLVREGRAISLAIPLDRTGPVHPGRSGITHFYGCTGTDAIAGGALTTAHGKPFQMADDYLFMPVQGSTQWDGLSHLGHDDLLYNGFWFGTVEAWAGARTLSIQRMKDRLTGRGVLLDLPRHLGVDRLSPGQEIEAAELADCAEAQGVRVGTGDILLVRTGHLAWWYELADTPVAKAEFWRASPGLSVRTVDWLHRSEIAALAADNISVEVEPPREPRDALYPLHVRLIRDLGMTIGEVWWLEELAAACAELGRWEFFLCAAPLNLTNASGSPLNPIAYL